MNVVVTAVVAKPCRVKPAFQLQFPQVGRTRPNLKGLLQEPVLGAATVPNLVGTRLEKNFFPTATINLWLEKEIRSQAFGLIGVDPALLITDYQFCDGMSRLLAGISNPEFRWNGFLNLELKWKEFWLLVFLSLF